MTEKEKRIQLLRAKEKIEQILKDNQIKLDIGGCACCGCPELLWIYFEQKGKIILDEEYFKIEMLSEND